ncbi:MAG: hypothetical protein LQ350_005203 [Teloschistes chrysophthalmus]|nr:MAG: hypothetical protein LQ350_005203 [Niorma chrysophthalma]
MAIITSANIIRSLSLFHLSLSYFLITSPSTLTNQSLVFILGASMQLPTPSSFANTSPASALTALVFALLGYTDLTACSLPEEVSVYFWGSQAPVRCAFFFALTGYVYAFKPKGPIRAASEKESPWDHLNNSIVFTWSFVEMICWFWVRLHCFAFIFITLRDERRELAIRQAEKKRVEENLL